MVLGLWFWGAKGVERKKKQDNGDGREGKGHREPQKHNNDAGDSTWAATSEKERQRATGGGPTNNGECEAASGMQKEADGERKKAMASQGSRPSSLSEEPGRQAGKRKRVVVGEGEGAVGGGRRKSKRREPKEAKRRWLHNPCRLGGYPPFRAGGRMRSVPQVGKVAT